MNSAKAVLCSIVACSCGLAFPGVALSQCPATPDRVALTRNYSGEYRNPAYGFSVAIPSPFVGHDVDNPLYQRGFMLLFPDPQESIAVYADVNSLGWESLSEAAVGYTKFFTDQAAKVVRTGRKDILLGRRAASEETSEYLCSDDPTHFSSVTVISLSADKRFVYALRWEGKSNERDRGYRVLQALVSSWKFQRPTS